MNEPTIKFTLVVATVGRTRELRRLLESLEIQTCRDFEVIVVDQNPPGVLEAVLAPFEGCFPILYLRSEIGLSRARNVALRHVRGQIVAFPDDDCWYAADVLECIESLLERHPEWDGLSGKLSDPANPNGFAWYHSKSGPVDIKNVWRRSASITIFLRREVMEAVGRFDEDLGRGASTGMVAVEESDYLIRALRGGFALYYTAHVHLYHRAPAKYHEERIGLVFGGSLAFGYVMRKHHYSFVYALHKWIRSLGGTALSLLQGDRSAAQYHWDSFRGRFLGWFAGSRCNVEFWKESPLQSNRWFAHGIEPIEDTRLLQVEEDTGAQGQLL